MGVPINGDTTKSSILIGFSPGNQPFWGTPIYGNPICPGEVCRFWVQYHALYPHIALLPPTTLRPSHRAHARRSRPPHDTAAPGNRRLVAGAWALALKSINGSPIMFHNCNISRPGLGNFARKKKALVDLKWQRFFLRCVWRELQLRWLQRSPIHLFMFVSLVSSLGRGGYTYITLILWSTWRSTPLSWKKHSTPKVQSQTSMTPLQGVRKSSKSASLKKLGCVV